MYISNLAEELPDGYFTPTIADLKARQQHLHARAVAANNAPLLTRAQREEQVKIKRDRWPNVRTTISFSPPPRPCPSLDSIILWRLASCIKQTTIRVSFPDRTQLEKVFPSSSKIRSVYAFVRDALREDVKPVKFILCMYRHSAYIPSIIPFYHPSIYPSGFMVYIRPGWELTHKSVPLCSIQSTTV